MPVHKTVGLPTRFSIAKIIFNICKGPLFRAVSTLSTATQLV